GVVGRDVAVPDRAPADSHGGCNGAVDAVTALALVECGVAGLVLLDRDVVEVPPEDRMAAMTEAPADDCPLQFLECRCHGDPALTHLDSWEAILSEVCHHHPGKVRIESDLLDIEPG